MKLPSESLQSVSESWPFVVEPSVCVGVAAHGSVALAVNVRERPPAIATSVLVPPFGPSVQLPTVAIPDGFVVVWSPVTVPPPLVTANVTATPPTGDPLWSRSMTDGRSATSAPGAAVSVVEEFAAIVAAELPGPDESPQETWSARIPAMVNREARLSISFIVGNIRESRAASRTKNGQGQRN